MALLKVFLTAFAALVLYTSAVFAGCSTSEKDALALCTVASMKDWNVSSVDFNTTSRKFCCFIWYALECQVKIARMCDSSLADQLSRETEKAYRGVCVLYPRKSPKCARPDAVTTTTS